MRRILDLRDFSQRLKNNGLAQDVLTKVELSILPNYHTKSSDQVKSRCKLNFCWRLGS